MPLVLSYVVAPSVGFHSARTISVVPYTLNLGFMEEVYFSPLYFAKGGKEREREREREREMVETE